MGKRESKAARRARAEWMRSVETLRVFDRAMEEARRQERAAYAVLCDRAYDIARPLAKAPENRDKGTTRRRRT